MKKLIALLSGMMLFAVSSSFAACPVITNHKCGCQSVQKVAIAQPCCPQVVKRCNCKEVKINPCSGKVQKSFMGRTLDTSKSIYTNTLGMWYDASFGALYNAYVD